VLLRVTDGRCTQEREQSEVLRECCSHRFSLQAGERRYPVIKCDRRDTSWRRELAGVVKEESFGSSLAELDAVVRQAMFPRRLPRSPSIELRSVCDHRSSESSSVLLLSRPRARALFDAFSSSEAHVTVLRSFVVPTLCAALPAIHSIGAQSAQVVLRDRHVDDTSNVACATIAPQKAPDARAQAVARNSAPRSGESIRLPELRSVDGTPLYESHERGPNDRVRCRQR
jgi:hypothetical protein